MFQGLRISVTPFPDAPVASPCPGSVVAFASRLSAASIAEIHVLADRRQVLTGVYSGVLLVTKAEETRSEDVCQKQWLRTRQRQQGRLCLVVWWCGGVVMR